MSRKTELRIRPLNPTIGAEVAGVDLSSPLEPDTVAAIRQALLDHLVLFFHDQEMTPEQQFRFSEYFAPVMIPTIDTISTEQPGVTVIDQTAPRGEYTDRWHTDHTFVEETPLGAILRAVQLPSAGGDTCFASVIEGERPDELVVYNYSSDVEGPDLPWNEGQVAPTYIYRHVLRFAPR